MANKFQLKRTSVSGRTANASILDVGELAINITDGIMYSTNGTNVFEVGANLTSLSVSGISYPTTDGTNGQVLTTNGSGTLTFQDAQSGGLNNVVEDLTPQLGGDLDLNGSDITGTGNITITGDVSAANLEINTINYVSPDGNNTITANMLDSDVLSFTGDSGELFSIADSLTGTIFSVNDISGIPSIEVDDDGTVRFAEIDGNVLIGSAVDNGSKLQVSGDIAVNSELVLDTETASLSTTTETQIASFALADYTSCKVIVQATNTVSGDRQVSELLIIHDDTTASVTEYGLIFTGSAAIASYNVDINSGDVRILATGSSTDSTTYKVTKNLITA